MENDSLMAKRLIEQTLTNWVNPELEKRKSEGKITGDFNLKSAQVIFTIGGPNIVRINEEIRAVVKAKINRPIKKGELIFGKDVENIESFRLVDEEKDFGHITIIHLSKGWFVGFSFIYDVTKSKELHSIAIEFMRSAQVDLEAKRYRSFVELASIAAENLAKARIYLLPDDEIRKAKTHKVIRNKVNSYARTNSVIKTDQKDVFNELMKLRDVARYRPDFILDDKKAKDMFEALSGLSKEISIFLIRFGGV